MPDKSFPFKPAKATQAAAILLDFERSRQMGYYRLLKLLYIADKAHLKATGRPIIGGRLVAMDKGPLHSAVYDLIKKQHFAYQEWSRYFLIEGRNIEMIENPGNLELSKREIQTLRETAEKLADRDDEELGTLTHNTPEYTQYHTQGTSTTIPLSAVIESVGRTAEADLILRDAKETAVLDNIFGG
ncbi:MAG: SocA family protein [Candidatus Nealsonbacteria bacterium]|nr:SocA family protein [Candidatus Nealsonbacteria bacterium]